MKLEPRHLRFFQNMRERSVLHVHFCVAGGSGLTGNGVIILPPVVLPESGAPAASNTGLIVGLTAFFGFTLLIFGVGLELKRRTQR